MSSITPLTFTGISDFSDDFQTILTRAVSIASLPVKLMQNKQIDILQQKQQASSLNTAVAALGEAVAALGAIGKSRAVVGSTSDSTKIAIVGTTAEAPATYTITEVSSIAKAATETSASGYADSTAAQVSASGELDLIVGTKTYHITLDAAHNNLVGLRDEINSRVAGVTASVLTTGTGLTPNYLSVSSNTVGETTLRLVENPDDPLLAAEFLTSANQGANTTFKLNGATVSKAATYINDVIPGVTFNVLKKTDTDESITLQLSSERTPVSNALSALVAKYNAAREEVNAQSGEAAGLLAGNNMVRETQNAMRALTGYQGTGTIVSLAELGIEMSSTGEMSFKSDTLTSLTDTQFAAVFDFFGSSTSGLGALEDRFTGISDPVTGLIKLAQDQFDATDTRLTNQIADLNLRIEKMEAGLMAKLQIADSLLAQLSTQQTLLTASIDSLKYTTFGKNES